MIDAIDVLKLNPLIGRSVENNNRELVIGRRAKGYAALYRHIESIDTVFVPAMRSQREAGYTPMTRQAEHPLVQPAYFATAKPIPCFDHRPDPGNTLRIQPRIRTETFTLDQMVRI